MNIEIFIENFQHVHCILFRDTLNFMAISKSIYLLKRMILDEFFSNKSAYFIVQAMKYIFDVCYAF